VGCQRCEPCTCGGGKPPPAFRLSPWTWPTNTPRDAREASWHPRLARRQNRQPESQKLATTDIHRTQHSSDSFATHGPSGSRASRFRFPALLRPHRISPTAPTHPTASPHTRPNRRSVITRMPYYRSNVQPRRHPHQPPTTPGPSDTRRPAHTQKSSQSQREKHCYLAPSCEVIPTRHPCHPLPCYLAECTPPTTPFTKSTKPLWQLPPVP
jgi:hypothetical protein